MPRELRSLSQDVQNKRFTKRTAFSRKQCPARIRPESAAAQNYRQSVRTTAPAAISTSYCHCCMSVFLWPLLQTALYPVTHSVPFHNGSVSCNPVPLRQVRTHVTPPVGRLGAVTLLTSFHNGSNSLDSMPLRYRAKRKGLPDAAVARALRIPSAMAPNPGNQCHCGLSAIDQDISR